MNRKKEFVGKVISAKMQKTVVVRVDRKVAHPVYKKHIIKSKNYHVHDASGICSEGDLVLIRETRPISKTKRWVVVKVLQRVKSPTVEE
ncbi:MAG: 30S ribosomal protein S17 [Aquificaceae bacterium]|nr:30S ribosomal protein S17 [Aquificaceae bacterium]